MSMRTKIAQDSNATYGANSYPAAGLDFDSSGNPLIQGPDGSTVWASTASKVTPWVLEIPVTAGDGAGVTESTANPYGIDVVVLGAVLNITTQSTGACTLDIGVGADATTSNDGLFDGLSAATAGIFNGAVNGGTNGRGCKPWGSGQFLNVAEASGDITALVGVLYLTIVPA